MSGSSKMLMWWHPVHGSSILRIRTYAFCLLHCKLLSDTSQQLAAATRRLSSAADPDGDCF